MSTLSEHMKPQGRLRLGELLVEARILSSEQLEQVLTLQRTDGRRLGTLLVERGLIGETQLTQILSQQLSVPWVSLHHIDFSRNLLSLVPRDICERYCLVPIYVRQVRGQGDVLYVAMDDPMNEEALTACSQSAGLPARPMIAAPSDIRAALRIYYAVGPASSRRASMTNEVGARAEGAAAAAAGGAVAPRRPPAEPAPSAEKGHEPPPPSSGMVPTVPTGAAAAASTSSAVDPALTSNAPVEPAPPSAFASADTSAPPPSSVPGTAHGSDPPQVEFREVEVPARAKKGRTMSLTLLDGTTIALPVMPRRQGPRAREEAEPAEHAAAPAPGEDVSVSELLAALRALAHGAEPSDDVQSYVRWEKLVAALLTLLIRKRLVMPREFIEELKKI